MFDIEKLGPLGWVDIGDNACLRIGPEPVGPEKKIPSQDTVDDIYEQLMCAVRLLEVSNIRYHLVAGSCLGLARHSGLIPWE